MCRDCGATFDSEAAANDHMMNCEHYSGYTDYYETVETQVPHTEEVQVEHAREVCSECGAVK